MNVKRIRTAEGSILTMAWLIPAAAWAGPYAPAAGQPGSTAVSMDDPSFAGWASGWMNYIPGAAVDAEWQVPDNATGAAQGEPYDVVCLGRGGEITMTFDPPIYDGPGWDFAVFENSFSDVFLELAYVEVSPDGTTFYPFPCDSLTSAPVGEYGTLDPTDVDGMAGKYRMAYGTPFDLEDLDTPVDKITHVRILDVVGDGTDTDSQGDPIYDPYPTTGSAGFDMDAIGYAYGAKSYVDTALCGGNEPCYPSIQDGLTLTATHGVVEVGQDEYEEDLVMGAAKRLVIRGGWNSTFSERIGWTTVQGDMTIANGTLVVENLIIAGAP